MAVAGQPWLPALSALYLGASLIAFLAYALDKSAARNRRRRIPERHLHLFSLLGGWPGAWAAQQLLRHKTSKRAFRWVFWATVLVNCGMLTGLIYLLPGTG